MSFACRCVNVPMGSYANQDVMTTPAGKIAGIDRCLVEEIKFLWSIGITTEASCCGHGVAPAFISVVDADIVRMIALGYERWDNPMEPEDASNFVPRGAETGA